MKIGARNQFVGQVVGIKKGSVMSQVTVKISAPVNMSSVMTLESLDDLGIKEGDKVMLVAKAINVLVIKE